MSCKELFNDFMKSNKEAWLIKKVAHGSSSGISEDVYIMGDVKYSVNNQKIICNGKMMANIKEKSEKK